MEVLAKIRLVASLQSRSTLVVHTERQTLDRRLCARAIEVSSTSVHYEAHLISTCMRLLQTTQRTNLAMQHVEGSRDLLQESQLRL